MINILAIRSFMALACSALVFSAAQAQSYSSPGSPWKTDGNKGTNSAIHYIGNSDNVALHFRTNNRRRLSIFEGGDIAAHHSLSVAFNLAVGNNLYVGFDGTFGRDLSVGRNLDVLLDGSFGRNMFVGNDGTFNHDLFVLNDLSVTRDGRIGRNLAVANDVSVGHDLTVANDGSVGRNLGVLNNLSVSNDAAIGHNFTVANNAAVNGTANSTSPTTGALVVAGGLGVGQDFYVAGESHMSTLKVDGSTDSTSPSTGALTVAGGAGIAKALFVGGKLDVGGTSNLRGPTSVAGNLVVNPGAVLVNTPGGGIFNVTNNGHVKILSKATGNSSNAGNFALDVQGQGQGIVVRLAEAEGTDGGVSPDHHFVAFWDKDNTIRGQIKGMTATSYFADPRFGMELTLNAAVTLSLAASVFEPGNVIQVIAQDVEYIARTAYEALWTLGVEYSSGNGDYAEFLPRVDENEKVFAGDVVGVFGGHISKRTAGAEQILVVSTAPAMVGNQPQPENEHLFNKVAFLGQVPVRITGPVHQGDYIVPSGNEDGTSLAIRPEMMTADDYTRIIGRAWTSKDSAGLGMVNVVVGLNGNDAAKMFQRQQSELDKLQSALRANEAMTADMRNEIAALKAILADLKQAIQSKESAAGGK